MSRDCTVDGLDCCVFCWRVFGDDTATVPPRIGPGVNYTFGPVVHAETGDEYDHVGATDGGDPLAHPACYKRWAATVNETDQSLAAFGVETPPPAATDPPSADGPPCPDCDEPRTFVDEPIISGFRGHVCVNDDCARDA